MTGQLVSRENQLRKQKAELEATVRQQAGRFVYTNARMKKLERALRQIDPEHPALGKP